MREISGNFCVSKVIVVPIIPNQTRNDISKGKKAPGANSLSGRRPRFRVRKSGPTILVDAVYANVARSGRFRYRRTIILSYKLSRRTVHSRLGIGPDEDDRHRNLEYKEHILAEFEGAKLGIGSRTANWSRVSILPRAILLRGTSFIRVCGSCYGGLRCPFKSR